MYDDFLLYKIAVPRVQKKPRVYLKRRSIFKDILSFLKNSSFIVIYCVVLPHINGLQQQSIKVAFLKLKTFDDVKNI